MDTEEQPTTQHAIQIVWLGHGVVLILLFAATQLFKLKADTLIAFLYCGWPLWGLVSLFVRDKGKPIYIWPLSAMAVLWLCGVPLGLLALGTAC